MTIDGKKPPQQWVRGQSPGATLSRRRSRDTANLARGREHTATIRKQNEKKNRMGGEKEKGTILVNGIDDRNFPKIIMGHKCRSGTR